MSEETYCRYCGKLIKYIRTAAGKYMPCDATRVYFVEDPRGPDFVYIGERESAYGYILQSEALGSVKAYRPHWGTCTGEKFVPRKGKSVKKAATAEGNAKQPAIVQAKMQEDPETESFEQLTLFQPERVKLKETMEDY
ncbi:MAG: hypothetical protein FWG88_05145 [Oscillospiraceae bacterium]|nr:hypothetical protein [Oscillospiraceae bacterium]